jgi:hypothetical protein
MFVPGAVVKQQPITDNEIQLVQRPTVPPAVLRRRFVTFASGVVPRRRAGVSPLVREANGRQNTRINSGDSHHCA